MQRFSKMGRVWSLAPLGFLVLSAMGCGTGKSFTHDGDPLLGNFNRPITPTPPPTGADIGSVWEGGPGIYPAPAISNNTVPYLPGQVPPLPGVQQAPTGGATSTYTLPGQPTTNASMAGGDRGAKATIRNFLSPNQNQMDGPASVSQRVGPSIALNNRFEQPQQDQQPQPQPWETAQDPNGVQFRQPKMALTSRGSAIIPEPNLMPTPAANSLTPLKNPEDIRSLEEGQQILTSHGVKWQRLEKVENGDWQFTCAVSSSPNATTAKQYSARHPDQMQAVKAVVEQVQRDR